MADTSAAAPSVKILDASAKRPSYIASSPNAPSASDAHRPPAFRSSTYESAASLRRPCPSWAIPGRAAPIRDCRPARERCVPPVPPSGIRPRSWREGEVDPEDRPLGQRLDGTPYCSATASAMLLNWASAQGALVVTDDVGWVSCAQRFVFLFALPVIAGEPEEHPASGESFALSHSVKVAERFVDVPHCIVVTAPCSVRRPRGVDSRRRTSDRVQRSWTQVAGLPRTCRCCRPPARGRGLARLRATSSTKSSRGTGEVESEVSSPNAFRIVVAAVAAAWMIWSLVAARPVALAMRLPRHGLGCGGRQDVAASLAARWSRTGPMLSSVLHGQFQRGPLVQPAPADERRACR